MSAAARSGPGRVLVVRNDATDPVGLLGQWLEAAGLELVDVRADAGDPVPSSVPDDIDAVISLGGAMSATSDAEATWLPAERSLLRDAVEREVPVLGVCLGGQLLTVALGGVVRAAVVPEYGLVQLDLTAAAADDPLFDKIAPGSPVAQYHSDEMAELPAQAVLLASTPACPHQAWRFGQNAWAVQFHPEIDAATLADWAGTDAATLAREGTTPAEVTGTLAAREREVAAVWEPFATAFAAVVRAAAHARLSQL
ncbi:MAG: type 1 glutamine amidotransferase [Candidatus Nanopelagicales bacterium]